MTSTTADRLHQLIAKWRECAIQAGRLVDECDARADGANAHAFLKERRIWTTCANELEALLAAPLPQPANSHESLSPDGDGPYAERGTTGDLQSVSTPLETQRRIEDGSEPSDSHSPALPQPAQRCGGSGMVAYWDGSAYAGEMCRGCVDCEPATPLPQPEGWQPTKETT